MTSVTTLDPNKKLERKTTLEFSAMELINLLTLVKSDLPTMGADREVKEQLEALEVKLNNAIVTLQD